MGVNYTLSDDDVHLVFFLCAVEIDEIFFWGRMVL